MAINIQDGDKNNLENTNKIENIDIFINNQKKKESSLI